MQPTIKSKPHVRASARQAQALAEAAGLVELEVDAFVAGGQFRESRAAVWQDSSAQKGTGCSNSASRAS